MFGIFKHRQKNPNYFHLLDSIMRKTKTYKLLSSTLPSIVFVLGVLFVAPAFSQDSTPLISVSGQGKVSAQPDQANISMQFSDINLDASKARQVVDKQVKGLLRDLKQYTIKEKSLDSSQTRIHPQYDYRQNRSELKGYQVQRTVSFILSDLDELEALIQTVSKAKAANLQPVQFSLSESDKLRKEALSKAIKQSKKTAERIADDYGVTLGKIHSVNFQSNHADRPMVRAMSMEMASADHKSTYEQKDLDFTANIQVSFTFE